MAKIEIRVNNEWVYVHKNLTDIKQTLTSPECRIAKEITKYWNRMQSKLQNLNQEMASVWEWQPALQDLSQNMVEYIGNLA